MKLSRLTVLALVFLLAACRPPATSSSSRAFTFTQTLRADTGRDDSFGGFDNAGLSVQGDVAVIAAPALFSDTFDPAVYIYERAGDGSWVQSATLPMFENGTDFGSVTAVGDDVAVVGSRENAYIYERDAGGAGRWGMVQRLFDPGEGNVNSVAISGQILVVGTWCKVRDNNPPVNGCRNVMFVFVREGATWVEEARLTPEDGPLGDFVSDVRVDGDTAALVFQGVPGTAYVFRRTGTVWSQEAILTGSEVGTAPPSPSAKSRVSLNGDTLALSDPGDSASQGVVYVFRRGEEGWLWQQEAALVGSDVGESSFFGDALALEGNTLVTSAEQGLSSGLGTVYVFRRDGATWGEEARFRGSAQGSVSFGQTLALSGDTLLVGSSPLRQPGTVYVYER